MMYTMKCIISHCADGIELPKCMYQIKNLNETLVIDECDLKIHDQVNKVLRVSNKTMTDLEKRQDELLKKLDCLYDRIKSISTICNVSCAKEERQISTGKKGNMKQLLSIPEEVVMVFGPDNLPWFWNILKNVIPGVNITWHVHSSVPYEKVPKIQSFAKIFSSNNHNSKVNVRLIFKNVSADSELKLSSLDVPIVGSVNILRYLSYVYPNEIPYDPEDFNLETLLDLCHKLERTPEKSKDSIVKKIFSSSKDWIHNNEFSIVDLAAYNIIKQWQNSGKSVPKEWLDKMSKITCNN